jgi:nucleoid-associated protein YgaU
MSLTHAMIEVEEQSVDESRGLPQMFSVQFNPTEYTLNKAAQIAEIAIPGIDSPILQFIRGQNEKLTLDLFFDTTTTKDRGMGANARDVRELTRSIYQLVKIQPDTHAPPRITFSWGQGLSFKAIVESVQQKFTLFNPAGIPLRATLSVTFREYKTLEQQISEMNLKSSDHTKRREVKLGDTLSAIAFQEYRDAQAWRHIADANPDVVANPRRLVPGTILDIPPLDVFGTPTVRRT